MNKIFFCCHFAVVLFVLTSCDKENNIADVQNEKSQISVTGNAFNISSENATVKCWANIEREFLTIVSFGVECSENSNMSRPFCYNAKSLNSVTVIL